ncbi:hypothetical protein EMCRGX_G033155 [Ephydatia muelleri]
MERVQSVLEPQPGPCLRKRPRREALQLRLADFPAVQRQMAQLKAHLQEPLSETRQTEPLANITVQATQRRLLMKWLIWKEILDVLKLQRELYESAGSTFAKAWESQKFTVLLMYCAIPPARGREYRELRFTFTEEDLQLWEPDSTQSNWLLLSGNHSRGLLYVGAHKTYRHIGVQRIELSADGSTNVLLEQLVAFVCRDRPALLQGRTPQDFLFLNHEGHPYATSDSWTKYIQSIFLQHKDVSISTNTIRASYVTHLLSGDDGVPEHVLVQAARAMRHSRKEQCRTYDKRTSSDKVAFAVDLSATQASSALGIAAGPSTSSRKASKIKKSKLPPSVGDIVALAEDASTREHPVILLGKVLRIYPDSREVLLAHLKQVEKSRKSRPDYKITAGRDAWVEGFDSLVFPIDIAYDTARGVYSLRTPVRDIHDHVFDGDPVVEAGGDFTVACLLNTSAHAPATPTIKGKEADDTTNTITTTITTSLTITTTITTSLTWFPPTIKNLVSRPNLLAQDAVDMFYRRWSLDVPETVSEALVQATALLTIPNAVRVMAWRKLGQILGACGGEVTVTNLANAANCEKAALYRELVDECAAGGCVACGRFKDNGTPYPCRPTQFTFRMLQPLFTNLTMSHLEACQTLARQVQPSSPLLTSGLFLPSSLKRFVSHPLIEGWNPVLGIGTPPPGPSTPVPPSPSTPVPPSPSTPVPPSPSTPVPPSPSTPVPPSPSTPVPPSPSTPVPPSPSTPLPSLVLRHELGAGHLPIVAVQRYGVRCQRIELHGLTLVPFRERDDDAPELGHVYHLTTTTTTTTKVPLGYWALVHARRLMTQCDSVVVVPHGVDGSGKRLVVEIFRIARHGRVNPMVSTGVDRIAAGLSYPVEGAPTQYHDAYQRAKRERCGLHAYGILDDDQVLPKALKGLLTGKGTRVVVENNSLKEVCTVLQDTTHLNEANILVLPSTIVGAGLALGHRSMIVTVPQGYPIHLLHGEQNQMKDCTWNGKQDSLETPAPRRT